jgi:hypothetical protein
MGYRRVLVRRQRQGRRVRVKLLEQFGPRRWWYSTTTGRVQRVQWDELQLYRWCGGNVCSAVADVSVVAEPLFSLLSLLLL